ncbi:MAG: recombinase family protein [Oligoflexales bacterium]
MRKVAIYARVSTDEQAKVEEGSIKNQLEALDRWVRGENLKYDGKWGQITDSYVDDGYSGKDLRRPQVRRLLSDIAKGKVDTVIMTEVSRLSRSVRDWIDLRAFFDDREAAFITLRQNFDTSTAMGRAMLSFAIEFSQLEREQTAERVKASCYARANRGLRTGGVAPYGFNLTDKPGHLQIDAAKQILADEILEIVVNQAGFLGRAVELINAAGYKREGGVSWTSNSLAGWIRNRGLIGQREVNRKNKNKDQDRLSESLKYRVVPAVWEPLVDEQRWIQANELLDRNYRKLKVPKWKYHNYILTGLIVCPNGKRLIGGSGWGQSGTKYVHYKHQEKEAGKCGCGIPTVSASKIEAKVISALKGLLKQPEVVDDLSKKANEDHKSKRPDYKESLSGVKRRLEGIVKKVDEATDLIMTASSAEEKRMWMEKAQRLQLQKEDLEKEIRFLTQAAEDHRNDVLNPSDIKQALSRLDEEFDHLPVAAKQSFLTAILSKVTVLREKIVVGIKNPGFSFGTLDEALFSPCYSGGRSIAYYDKWLLRRDLNSRPGD